MIEVERKFRLSEECVGNMKATLEEKFGAPKSEQHTDLVFLHEKTSFADFKRGDPVMRIRLSDGASFLGYKRAINDSGDRVEYELSVDSFENAKGLLKEFGYVQVITVEKTRLSFSAPEVSVVLDDVRYLGHFLEVESLCESNDGVEAATEKIMRFARQFGLSEQDIEEKKYDELMAVRK